jgi:hypothetical protein
MVENIIVPTAELILIIIPKNQNCKLMINKNNIRAIYKPDSETKDGTLYFYPQEVDGGETLMWVCEKDSEIKYFFDIPFLDNDWEIQQRTDLQTIDGQYIYEGDKINIQYECNEFHDLDVGDFIFYVDKNLNLCINEIGTEKEFDMYWNDFSMHAKIKISLI